MLLNMLFYGDWFITNRSAIEICTICQSANKEYVKVIEVCCKTVFVLSQLTCIYTYIKQNNLLGLKDS